MATELVAFPRRFQLWMYVVGHKQLLLRSTKDHAHQTRVDILFKAVEAVHLPTAFDGLVISEGTEEEIRQSGLDPGLLKRDEVKTFLVRGSDFSGYVIAGMATWHEDDLEYYDPSHFASSWELPPTRFRFYYLFKIRIAIFLAKVRGLIPWDKR